MHFFLGKKKYFFSDRPIALETRSIEEEFPWVSQTKASFPKAVVSGHEIEQLTAARFSKTRRPGRPFGTRHCDDVRRRQVKIRANSIPYEIP
jgi:hypothetical protein